MGSMKIYSVNTYTPKNTTVDDARENAIQASLEDPDRDVLFHHHSYTEKADEWDNSKHEIFHAGKKVFP